VRVSRKLLLVAFGLGLPLLVAELALQLSSGFYRSALLATRAESIDQEAKRILCVGDSNTFGVRVAAGDSYPGQLETMLGATARTERWQVINRGIPGQNTTQIRDSLPELLAAIEPELVLVMGGLNNSWNEAQSLTKKTWLERSRLLRLVRLALNNLRAGSRDGDGGGDGGGEIAAIERIAGNDVPAIVERTIDDLVAIATICRAASATPVFMTYPGQHPHGRPINDAARVAAQRENVVLVDHDRAFAPYVERYGYDAILFEDSHPAEAGYRLLARDLVAALSDAGLIAAELPPDRFEPTQFRELASLRVEHDAVGAPIAFVLRAEPDAEFQIYVSPVREPELDLGTRKVPVGLHPWLEFCKSHEPFSGRLDATGAARVELPREVSAIAPGDVLHAAFVTRDPRALHDAAVRSISAAVTVARR
jgi:lysophospholipase L1-like esterase